MGRVHLPGYAAVLLFCCSGCVWCIPGEGAWGVGKRHTLVRGHHARGRAVWGADTEAVASTVGGESSGCPAGAMQQAWRRGEAATAGAEAATAVVGCSWFWWQMQDGMWQQGYSVLFGTGWGPPNVGHGPSPARKGVGLPAVVRPVGGHVGNVVPQQCMWRCCPFRGVWPDPW